MVFPLKNAIFTLGLLRWKKRKTEFSWTPASQAMSESKIFEQEYHFYGIYDGNWEYFVFKYQQEKSLHLHPYFIKLQAHLLKINHFYLSQWKIVKPWTWLFSYLYSFLYFSIIKLTFLLFLCPFHRFYDNIVFNGSIVIPFESKQINIIISESSTLIQNQVYECCFGVFV